VTVAFSLASGSVEFDGTRVLKDATLTVEQGEFIAILGENGSGKTSMMRALLGLTDLSEGRAEVLGTPIGQFRDWNRIAYVPQRLLSAGAVPVSVYEVVAASRIGPRTRWRRGGAASRAAVRSALDDVGLWHRRRDRLDDLSGGQQRRVLIAAALAKGATVFVLDEPTAGVDAEQQVALAGTFRTIRDRGGTVLLVTHELGPFRDLATRVIVLDHGRITYDGPSPGPNHHDHVWHHSEDVAVPPRPGPLDGGAGVHE